MSQRREKKRHGCRNFILYCLILAGVWYYGTFTLKTTEITIESDQIAEPVTIVQLTDLHGASFGKDNGHLIAAVREADPDFVVATGDMFTAGDKKGEDTAVSLLGALAELYPVYSVNGEHDDDKDYERRLTRAGVDVLDYEWRDIKAGANTVRLYGITNVYYTDTFDLHNEFDLDQNYYNILLAHISNFEDFAGFGMDLSLCGDSHGGQIRLPYIGGLNNRGEWFPELSDDDAKYVKGLYEDGEKKLFVSSGLGNYPIPVRFFNRPEIAVIHLTGK